MKLNVNVEQLINDITSSIRFNCSYDDIKHCHQYPRENLITFELEMKPLSIFNYLSRDEAEELYNELFVKDDRILSGLKEFAKVHYFTDAAIEQDNEYFSILKPMLLLYKSKEEYVEEIVNQYCYRIKYRAKGDIGAYGSRTVPIELIGIDKYFVPDIDKYAYVFSDDRILKELKSFANKHGYEEGIFINPLNFILLKKNIDINKK